MQPRYVFKKTSCFFVFVSKNMLEGVSKLSFQCGRRGCIKIMKDAKKGLRSCPIMLNAGRGAAEPEGEYICIQAVIRPPTGTAV